MFSTAHVLCNIIAFGSKSCSEHDLFAKASDHDRTSALLRPNGSTATAEKLLRILVFAGGQKGDFGGPTSGVTFWAPKSRTRKRNGLSVYKSCPQNWGPKSDPTFGPQKALHFSTRIQSIIGFLIMRALQKLACISPTNKPLMDCLPPPPNIFKHTRLRGQ